MSEDIFEKIPEIIKLLLEHVPDFVKHFKMKKHDKIKFDSKSSITFEYKDSKNKEDLQFIVISDNEKYFFLDVALIRETIKIAIKSFEDKKISRDDFITIFDALSKLQSNFQR